MALETRCRSMCRRAAKRGQKKAAQRIPATRLGGLAPAAFGWYGMSGAVLSNTEASSGTGDARQRTSPHSGMRRTSGSARGSSARPGTSAVSGPWTVNGPRTRAVAGFRQRAAWPRDLGLPWSAVGSGARAPSPETAGSGTPRPCERCQARPVLRPLTERGRPSRSPAMPSPRVRPRSVLTRGGGGQKIAATRAVRTIDRGPSSGHARLRMQLNAVHSHECRVR
jgi:hypothetical protein